MKGTTMSGETGGTQDPNPAQSAHEAELKRVATAEHGKGVTAGKRDILTKAGFKTTDEMVAWVTQQREASSNATELQQQVTTLTQEKAGLQVKVATMDKVGAVTQGLLASGVNPERAASAAQLILSRPEIASNPDGAPSAEVITASIASFKSETPEWFPQAGQPQTQPPAQGVPDPNQQQQAGGIGMPPPLPVDAGGVQQPVQGVGPVPAAPVPPVVVGAPPPAGQPPVLPAVQGVQGAGAPGQAGSAANQQRLAADAWFERLNGAEVQQQKRLRDRQDAQPDM